MRITYLFAILIILINFPVLNSQNIFITNEQFKDNNIILAFHYGKKAFLLKEDKSNDMGITAFYNDSLESGIYYIFFPDSSTVEFMYDKDYTGDVSISFDSTNDAFMINGPVVSESYMRYLNSINKIEHKNVNSIDSLNKYYSGLYPNSLLEVYLRARQKVKIPDKNNFSDSAIADSEIWNYRLNYYYKHFLDNVDLSDKRLLSTPVFVELIDKFILKVTPQSIEGLSRSVEYVINRARDDSVTRSFTVDYLIQLFNNKKNDAIYEYVLLELIEKYYLTDNHSLSKKANAALIREYNLRKPGSLHQIAPDILLPGESGKLVSLHELKNTYTLLYFYNYNCPLCNKLIPAINKLINRYNYLNIEVMAVCTGTDSKEWLKYIHSHKIGHWTNVIDSNEFASYYNLSYTPTLFFLDSGKKIIGKNINITQLEEILLEEAKSTYKDLKAR